MPSPPIANLLDASALICFNRRMASTDENLRAIEKMLDEKFKLSEKRDTYYSLSRKGNPSDPITGEQSHVAFAVIMAELKAIRYLLSEEYFSAPFPPS